MTALNDFYERSFADLLCASPEVAAELGVREVSGRAIPYSRFTDVSPAGDAARRELMASSLRQLQAQDDRGLDAQVYEFFLRWANFGHLRGTESAAYAHCDYVADHLGGMHSEMLTCLGQWYALASEADAQ